MRRLAESFWAESKKERKFRLDSRHLLDSHPDVS